jgi:membrane protein DedA with SNARE-associated domain
VAAWLDALLERMLLLPEPLLLLILGAAATIENLVPPVPADVIIAFGGFLAGMGASTPWRVFLVVWTTNVGGAAIVYSAGRRYGPAFFGGRLGRWVLQPRQLASLSTFYQRHGFGVILFGRLLPMFRSVVPAFAGVAGLGVIRTFVPIAIASGAWYGTIIYLGGIAGQNWEVILGILERSGRWFSVLALVVAVVALAIWRRSRASSTEPVE